MESKTLTIILIVIACVFLFPVAIGIIAGIFGVLGGIIGGLFGMIAGLFGAVFGLIGSVFGFFGWLFGGAWHWAGFFNPGPLAVVIAIVVIVLLARSQTARRGR